MFPTAYQDCVSLEHILQNQSVLPLHHSGPLVRQLAELCRDQRHYSGITPESIEVKWEENFTLSVSMLPVSQASQTAPSPYDAPELRSIVDKQKECCAVYSLCALFYDLLSGEKPKPESVRARRAGLSRLVATLNLPFASGEMLRSVLDRGLRLEPSRRYPSLEQFIQALNQTEAFLNQEAQDKLHIVGRTGELAGQTFLLQPPMTLGRQPDLCDILFPIDTRGVSRRHCCIELEWGMVLVTDLNSSYGTFLNSVPIPPLSPCLWMPETQLWLGSQRQIFSLRLKL